MLSKWVSKWWRQPYIPLLVVSESLNQQKTEVLLSMLKSVNYKHVKAIGMVVEVDNHMPVQLDKLAKYLEKVRQQYGLKVYGFCQTNVTLESYYLLSLADEIYTLPTTLFQLQRGAKFFQNAAFLKNMGIEKTVVRSDPKVLGNALDSYTTVFSSRFLNMKFTEVAQRIYWESRLNRIRLNAVTLPQEPPTTMLGQEAVQKRYVDQLGSYYQILTKDYPNVEVVHIKAKDTIKILEMLTPFLLGLFLFKVFLKYAILFYIWRRTQAQGADQSSTEGAAH